MSAPVAVKAVSKAQRFALAAEAFGDWTVERIKSEGGKRTVKATRGDESFAFTWSPNPGGLGSLKFDSGVHEIADRAEAFANVKAALRFMAEPEGVVRVIEHNDRRSSTGTRTVRLAFDPAIATDVELLEAVAGKKVTWTNSLSGELESGRCPRGGIHLKLEDKGDKRILTFVSQDGYTGFRSVDVNAIVEVAL